MIIKSIVNKLIRFLHKQNRVNFVKTIAINIVYFPLKTALKFPIIIYGPCRLQKLSGQIIFDGEIKTGILKIGLSDPVRSWNSYSFISLDGKIHLGKQVILRRGINLQVSRDTLLNIEDNVSIGHNCTLIVHRQIYIGKGTSIGNNTTIMDSDFHYVVNLSSRMIKPASLPIIIGECNWIASWCTIKKGTQTPKGTIVAGPYSMLGKNYVGKIPEFSLIAGSPAKLLVEGVRRVNNMHSENELIKHFAKTSSNYVLPDDVDLDEFCMP